MIQRGAVAFVPEICLVGSIASFAHVDRFQAGGLRGQTLRPGMFIVNAIAESERVARTDNADLAGWHAASEICVVAEALGVRLQEFPRAIHVGEVDIRK